MLCTTWGIADSLTHVNADTALAAVTQLHVQPSSNNEPLRHSIHRRMIHLPLNFANRSFEFVDYDAHAFAQLRVRCGLEDSTYLRSFTINSDGVAASMLEKFTEGRSGSFFYFTHDYKYIVKTVTSDECVLLQRILPSYLAHVTANPTTLLTRFLGLHSIRMSAEQVPLSFVVMQNVFATRGVGTAKLHQVYDLKGSYVHRSSLKPGQHVSSFRGTLKDSDLSRKFRVGATVVQSLRVQLIADVRYLLEQGIMDYSLLVGIHDCDRTCAHPESTGDGPEDAIHGGIKGVGEAENSTAYYFVGIIDMLQLYNMQKKLEHMLKTRLRCDDPHGISAVPPPEYALRFQERVLPAFE